MNIHIYIDINLKYTFCSNPNSPPTWGVRGSAICFGVSLTATGVAQATDRGQYLRGSNKFAAKGTPPPSAPLPALPALAGGTVTLATGVPYSFFDMTQPAWKGATRLPSPSPRDLHRRLPPTRRRRAQRARTPRG